VVRMGTPCSHPETSSSAQALACPSCGSTELSTIEEIQGLAGCTVTRNADGTADIDHDGYTDILWDTSTTAGVSCASCEWDYRGDDWAAQLV
jgi:hypothetical protein